jgi:hypothetical protein
MQSRPSVRLRTGLPILAVLTLCSSPSLQALNYPYQPYNDKKMDPQPTGWPLSPRELAFVANPAHTRRIVEKKQLIGK